jgi:hypothetical protein
MCFYPAGQPHTQHVPPWSIFTVVGGCLGCVLERVFLRCLQASVKIQNTVTLGATSLNNNSNAYASYAILIDQAIGHQVEAQQDHQASQ